MAMEITSSKRCIVLIMAAGSGERFGSGVPKQYLDLAGKPVLRRSVEIFKTLPFVDEIRVVINPLHAEMYKKAVSGIGLDEPVSGGRSRQESVYFGLRTIDAKDDDIVMIHDAARPLTSPEDVSRLYIAMQDHQAATLATRAVYTLVRSLSGSDYIEEYIDRSDKWSVHTPQAFRFGRLMEAHERAKGMTFTDDTTIARASGIKVMLVECNNANFKITGKDDLVMAEKLLAPKTETRTATGFDVHAFRPSDGGVVRLCGVDIPHDRALEGHSDADVALHALTDALLGVAGEGDIGKHFPPSEAKWKGEDSSVFVKKACELVAARGGRIVNLDITIICQSPKIGPYRETMRERVAEIAGIDALRVNVKATTTEGLGFTGRGEGIAAQACASVEFPEQ